MAITRCPRCGEHVRIPTAEADARVQCPWCTEQYELAEAIEKLPPSLVVLEEGPAAVATGIGLGLDEGDEAGSNEYFVSDEEAESASFEGFDTAAAAASTGSAGTAIRTRQGRRRKPSAIWMLIQWVGGGVAGVAIALAILWYFDRLPQTELFSWINDFEQPSSPAQRQPTLEELGIDEQAEPATSFAMPEPADEDAVETFPATEMQVPEDDDPEVQDEPRSLEVVEPSEESVDLEPVDERNFGELRQALDRASELEDGSSEAARRSYFEVYRQLAAVGSTAGTAQIDLPQLHALLEQAEATESLVDTLAETAPRWIELGSRRPNQGIVAVGEITSGTPPRLETADGTIIELEGADDGAALPKNTTVVLVGRLLTAAEAAEGSQAVRARVGVIHEIGE